MAGLVPAIYVLASASRKTWMPGPRPGTTIEATTAEAASSPRLGVSQARPHDLTAGGILGAADIGGTRILHLHDLSGDEAELDAAIARRRLAADVHAGRDRDRGQHHPAGRTRGMFVHPDFAAAVLSRTCRQAVAHANRRLIEP